MELPALLVLVAMLVPIVLYIGIPLTFPARRKPVEGSGEISALLAERDSVIRALQELDFDAKLGKVPEDDYPSQRAELLRRGGEVLQKLDAQQQATGGAPKDAADRIERAAADRQADGSRNRAELDDDEIAHLLAARRASRKGRSAGFCPRCGKAILSGDQFCPSCGKSLS